MKLSYKPKSFDCWLNCKLELTQKRKLELFVVVVVSFGSKQKDRYNYFFKARVLA